MCHIPKESQQAELLHQTKAMIYNKCLMNHKHCFEALDHTLQDVQSCDSSPYGGLTVIHSGDFQQILHVIIKGNHEDVIEASLQQFTFGIL